MYAGVDMWQAPNMTAELRPYWRYGDIERSETLPLGERWDVVICFDVLYHLLSPLRGLLNLCHLTRGCLVIGTAIIPEGESLSSNLPVDPHVAKGPLLRFEPGFRGDETNYFFPTEMCLVRMLNWAGFDMLQRQFYYPESRIHGFFVDRVSYHCWKQRKVSDE